MNYKYLVARNLAFIGWGLLILATILHIGCSGDGDEVYIQPASGPDGTLREYNDAGYLTREAIGDGLFATAGGCCGNTVTVTAEGEGGHNQVVGVGGGGGDVNIGTSGMSLQSLTQEKIDAAQQTQPILTDEEVASLDPVPIMIRTANGKTLHGVTTMQQVGATSPSGNRISAQSPEGDVFVGLVHHINQVPGTKTITGVWVEPDGTEHDCFWRGR